MAWPRRCRRRPRRATCSSSTPPARWSPRCISRPPAITRRACEIVLIGHAGHPEVIGTMGQLPPAPCTLIETAADARALRARATPSSSPSSRRPRCRSTTRPQSSPSCKARFPDIVGPHKEDICYATTNRQAAVKAIAAAVDCAARRRRPQQLQLAAAGRGGRARRLPEGACWSSGAATSPGSELDGIDDARHHRRRLGARDCSSRRSSTPSATRFDVTVETVTTARGAHRLQRAARAARAPLAAS